VPPLTVGGFKLIDARPTGAIVRVALWGTPPAVAVMIDVETAVTGVVVIENVPELNPTGIVTELGTDAMELLLERLT